ncbi:unnamed protein product [Closterium sp. NIES-53]
MCINYRALNKQTALTTAPVLILPDPDRDYVVEADASNQAVGAVLMQDHGNGLQPIAYLSKKLHRAELNYPIHDKEALAIVVAFKAWRCYLKGAKTTVYTDHCSLKYLKSQPTFSRRQVRWVDFLETHFHYDILYKPGLHNKADALSCPGHVAGIQLDGMNPLLKGLFQHGKDLGIELRPATADPIGGVPRRTIRGTFREQQDVSRNSEVLLLAPDGSRCAAVCHLLRHVPADEEQQVEKKQGYFSLYPYRSSHGRSLASTSSQDFLRPHGGTTPSSW